jgi:hypothetical protein
MKIGLSLATLVLSILFAGCASYQTHTNVGGQTEKPSISGIENKNGSLTLTLKGSSYYGNLVFDAKKRFELHPMIANITGNAKGHLVSKTGKTITCVMELMEETKSGTGYCLEEDNPQILKFSVINMD